MNYKAFIGQVQHRLEFAQLGQAVRATRAVLTTLGERLHEGEATDLASPLPMEIDRYVTTAEHGQRFDYQEFLDRVADRANVDRSDANYYAQQIVAVVADVVPPGNIEKIENQLPDDFNPLFDLIKTQETEQ
ncbi:DUF2267 family protein (plasmid) [Natrialba magadii ATCC 43099]|uniref:DUF2267 family protein n=1 Tax=Natrialba magadii (strain ATCC 43099 / DSM 3394 / CCM 3739 / CIP 104546 / IAM 13178 / JCM 8861 / NBRC 102185 / NCIMB 2190 / MS3) TaxID=547559 RepID=D3T1A5_NATMM|nr:DUF2267 domain-containing protein [Natrialba magadii]ADD07364.1 DUF2267 family protein [Natrialba magadii ATCC 43099]ELY32434.1 hypothetical protein C500_03819 [Natrialba magadii ATCC 43099]